jgi:hypothetical protein
MSGQSYRSPRIGKALFRKWSKAEIVPGRTKFAVNI